MRAVRERSRVGRTWRWMTHISAEPLCACGMTLTHLASLTFLTCHVDELQRTRVAVWMRAEYRAAGEEGVDAHEPLREEEGEKAE